MTLSVQKLKMRARLEQRSVKTAICLDSALFREAEGLARRMKASRSRFIAIAIAEFIERRRNQELLAAANRAYVRPPDAAEKRLRQAMRRQQRSAGQNPGRSL